MSAYVDYLPLKMRANSAAADTNCTAAGRSANATAIVPFQRL